MSDRTLFRIKWICIFLLWIYIILRAYFVSITHDEAYSFLLVKTNYIKAMGGTANTHWLNSLGMKIGSLISFHPLFLRWGSVLLWLLYGFSAIRISESTRNKAVGFLMFATLVFNPFMIDFFSLARGYGMMCAFTLTSLFHVGKAIDEKSFEPRHWWLAFLFASLAVFSNYTALYYFLSLTALFGFYLLPEKKWYFFFPVSEKKWWWLLISGTITIAVANLLFIKLYTGDLEYGGDDFVTSVFGSLVSGSLYFKGTAQLANLLTYALLAGVTAGIIRSFVLLVIKKRITPFTAIGLITCGMLLFNVVFHLLFGTPYLYSRTTLIFYPLFVCLLCLALDQISFFYRSWFKLLTSGSVLIAVLIHFFTSVNLKFCYEWPLQAETKEALNVLIQQHPKRVLVQKWHGGVLENYYKVIQSDKYNFDYTRVPEQQLVNPDESFLKKVPQYDYALLLPPVNYAAFSRQRIRFEVIKEFPATGAQVVRIINQR